ncbi:MAG: bifunctional glutamate N-acetyltransferase/amino-acid acetyltransferase ArgJ [Alphaproteobacteria bacterium]|nr:bifunctional glutamate N-acetyltransferase/amino-acid acetyltransferase ArgJ [Alphaproteobacteria bacterium]
MAKSPLPRSPLAPATFPPLPPVPGVRLAAAKARIRYDRLDVLLVAFAPGTAVAGVFTRSRTASAPVEWCRAALKHATARAVIVNSGNANAFTGYEGARAVAATTAGVAQLLSCRADEVFVSSTGVIGEPLPIDRLLAALPELRNTLADDGWSLAAEAIRTTDTFAKGATRTFTIDGKSYVLNGIAKGSGMIAPDMATMLAYLATDAAVPAPVLQALLKRANDVSFNALTVDGDTSTSDTVLLFATGQGSAHPAIGSANDQRLNGFKRALRAVMIDLAQQVARDGEGASKFISVTVTGAVSGRAARRIALSIANSPLLKTAFAGGDPNWGRVVMAVGKAGEKADRDKLRIHFGDLLVAENGAVAPGYREELGAAYMQGREIQLRVDVGVGRGQFTVWTCDLTEGYVRINADYRS